MSTVASISGCAASLLSNSTFFFFSSRRRHTRWPRDWSSDVCSSDLLWFLEKGAHREIVKFGLTLIGMTNCEAHREKILTQIGRASCRERMYYARGPAK